MARVYSTQFFCQPANPGLIPFITCPADETWVLRDLNVVNGSSGGAQVNVNVVDPVEGPTTVVALVVGATPAMGQWTGRIVVKSGDELYIQVGGTTTVCYLVLSGYRLTLP